MMGAKSPFEKLFNNFLQAIQDADKSFEVASHFGPNKSTESMFKYFWGLEEAQQCLDFRILESFKSQSQADHLRTEGNIYYKRGQFDQALELYNMCIMYAPPPLKNNVIKEMSMQGYKMNMKEQQSTSLAFGFANRSAVLFDLEQYEKSINDIDFALQFGYPIEQIFKLIERKVKCLLELKKQEDAITLLNSTLNLLSTLNMAESKKIAKRNKLLSFLNKLQQDQTNTERYEENIPHNSNTIENLINMKYNQIDSSDGRVNPTSEVHIPRLASQHHKMLSVSSALRLQYTNEQGRFYVADRDIDPGELILAENSPFSCLHLQKDILSSHCCVCLMKCNNPVPCHSCTMVIFCTEACRTESCNGHTKVECKTLATLESLYVSNYCPLAFKVITQIPYMKLKTLIPASKIQITESTPELNGFNRKGVFDSSDFLSTYAMITNQSQRDGDDLFKKVAMAFVLTNLLIKSNQYFIDEAGLSFHPTDEDIIFLGSTFVTLVMSFNCNTHAIEELHNMNNDEQTIRGIGAAAFPAHSLVNHSCNPSIVRCTIGRHMTSYAIRFIPKGSEVADSYGPHYAVHETEYRQAVLKKNYCFECKCEACIGEWRISERQTSKPTFKSLEDANMYEKLENNEESKQGITDLIDFLDRYRKTP